MGMAVSSFMRMRMIVRVAIMRAAQVWYSVEENIS